jgi:hypothetical protein
MTSPTDVAAVRIEVMEENGDVDDFHFDEL